MVSPEVDAEDEDVVDLKLMDVPEIVVLMMVLDSLHLNDLRRDQVYSSSNYAVESFDDC